MDEDPTPSTEPAPDHEDTATLVVVGPSYVSSLNLPQDDGSILVIDRTGRDVPSGDVDRIMAAAVQAGVTLTRKAH
jgi:hypothetical protein